jgi:hypothetical protein
MQCYPNPLESNEHRELWDESQKECIDHHWYVQFHGLRHLLGIYAVLYNLNTTHCYSEVSVFFQSNSRCPCMARPKWKHVNILRLMATIHSICSQHFLKPSVFISGVLSPTLKDLSFVTQLSKCIKELGIEWNEWLRDASAGVGSCLVENSTFAISFQMILAKLWRGWFFGFRSFFKMFLSGASRIWLILAMDSIFLRVLTF